MSTLTGQQIKDTYDGLLKLADSTNGITPNLQAVQDGLGNNTGSRIATNYFTAPNVVNLNANLVPDMMGCGFNAGVGGALSAGVQNKLLYNIFYDSGTYAYSAVSYNLGTSTSTSDVVDMYFYSLQLVPGYGVAPKNLLMSGITLTSTGTTGVKTTTLPSTLSFSGTGGGFYIFAIFVSNAGVNPTVRYGNQNVQGRNQSFVESLGYFMNPTNTASNIGNRMSSIPPTSFYIINTLPVQNSYSESDIANNLSTATSTGLVGFGLNTIR